MGGCHQLPHHAVQVVGLKGIGLVERLRAHLEAQVFHLFEDMVVALEEDDVLVADGVVAFLVVEIEQRTDLRETVCYILQQAFCLTLTVLIVEVELYDDHPLACVRVADDDVAQQSRLLPQVEEGDAVLQCIVAYGVSYLVVERLHQVALFDGQNLVEGSRDVES